MNITLLNVELLGRSFTGTAGHSAARLKDLAESIEIHNAEHGLTHLWALNETGMIPGQKLGISIGDYRFISRPRVYDDEYNGYFGGTGFLVHSSLSKVKVLPAEYEGGASSSLWLELTSAEGKLLYIGTTYSDCSSSCPCDMKVVWAARKRTISRLIGSGAMVVWMGDFNSHIPSMAQLQANGSRFTRPLSPSEKSYGRFLDGIISGGRASAGIGLSVLNGVVGAVPPMATCYGSRAQAAGGSVPSVPSRNGDGPVPISIHPSVLDLALVSTPHLQLVRDLKVLSNTHTFTKHKAVRLELVLPVSLCSVPAPASEGAPACPTRIDCSRLDKPGLEDKLRSALAKHPDAWLAKFEPLLTPGNLSNDSIDAANEELVGSIRAAMVATLGNKVQNRGSKRKDATPILIKQLEMTARLATRRMERLSRKAKPNQPALEAMARLSRDANEKLANARSDTNHWKIRTLLCSLDMAIVSHDPGKVAEILKRLQNKSARQKAAPPVYDLQGNYHSTIKGIAEAHRQVWEKHGNPSSARSTPKLRADAKLVDSLKGMSCRDALEKHPPSAVSGVNPDVLLKRVVSILNGTITLEEVKEALEACRSKSSPGADEISFRVLKLLDDCGLACVVLIFNACLRAGHTPQSWRTAVAKPLFKYDRHETQKASDPSNYRAISLLPTLMKLLERVLYFRISRHLEAVSPLHRNQQGFRKDHDSASLAFCLMECIKHRPVNSPPILMCDLCKAFPNCPRNALLAQMHQRSICGDVFKLVAAMFHQNRTEIEVMGTKSDPYSITQGVREGSCLAPLIFAIFIDSLLHEIECAGCGYYMQEHVSPGRGLGPAVFCGVMGFADDICCVPRDFADLRKIASILGVWGVANQMCFGWEKTVLLLVRCDPNAPGYPTPQQMKVELTCLHGGVDNIIRHKDDILKHQNEHYHVLLQSHEYLGFQFHVSGNWNCHIEHLLPKVRQRVGMVRTTIANHDVLGPSSALSVIDMYVMSVVRYGCAVWGTSNLSMGSEDCPESVNLKALERAFKSPLRDVIGVMHNTPSLPLHVELGWLGVRAEIARAQSRMLEAFLRMGDSRLPRQVLIIRMRSCSSDFNGHGQVLRSDAIFNMLSVCAVAQGPARACSIMRDVASAVALTKNAVKMQSCPAINSEVAARYYAPLLTQGLLATGRLSVARLMIGRSSCALGAVSKAELSLHLADVRNGDVQYKTHAYCTTRWKVGSALICGMIDSFFPGDRNCSCPCCHLCVSETPEHALFHCAAHTAVRSSMFAAVLTLLRRGGYHRYAHQLATAPPSPSKTALLLNSSSIMSDERLRFEVSTVVAELLISIELNHPLAKHIRLNGRIRDFDYYKLKRTRYRYPESFVNRRAFPEFANTPCALRVALLSQRHAALSSRRARPADARSNPSRTCSSDVTHLNEDEDLQPCA